MNLAVAPAPSRSLSRPGWLLALAPVPAFVWVAAVIATMSGSGVDRAGDLTRAQLDGIRVGWVLQWVLFALATGYAAVALALLNRALPQRRLTGASQLLLAVSALAGVATLVLRTVAAGFDEARLGDNGAYSASLVASYVSAWAAVVAVILTGLVLRSTGVLRRTGLVVAIVAGVLLLLDVVTLALPPWLVAFYLLAFGIGLLRRRVLSPA